ncbi:hypothetical protein G6F43_009280 [Rhizopus delemar]|nr:hypothetical protein G6F43_009280 [Rhizopus delemar]
MKVTCMIENFTVQKVPKCVVLASGAVRVQMDLSYGGNTLQVSTYDLGLGEMMIKCFLVGTVQTVKGTMNFSYWLSPNGRPRGKAFDDIEGIKEEDKFLTKEDLEEEYRRIVVYTYVLQNWSEEGMVEVNCAREVAMAKMNETAKRLHLDVSVENVVESDTVRARGEKRRRMTKEKWAELSKQLVLSPVESSSRAVAGGSGGSGLPVGGLAPVPMQYGPFGSQMGAPINI